MIKSDLKIILEEKEISLIEDYNFKSKNNEIEFLNRLEKLLKNGINIKILNIELINIINEIEINEKIILKL
ncbi:MAG: hypothetical protein KC589_00555, partial [Nanoarchaeota archaeon]|nr:hypothetical protein [Nanoarchaeota archaeon]